MPLKEPRDQQRDSDARIEVQSVDDVAASVELSIPHHVRQHAAAPEPPSYVLAEPLGLG